MENTEIFESLNLNPQLFINEILNTVDDLLDGAFDYFHQEAVAQLNVEGTEKAKELSQGINYVRNMIQSELDTRLQMWEKYCLINCFKVPEGFSLPDANESCGDLDIDNFGDSDLDAQLDSLRHKLTLVEKESSVLNQELQALESQSVISNQQIGTVNEVLQLFEQCSGHEMFQELVKTASDLRSKVKMLKTNMVEETEHRRMEKFHVPNGDLLGMKCGKGFSNATPEVLEEFLAGLRRP